MNGYIYAATCNYKFYRSACYSAETLKENYPDANITLFTHKEWVDSSAKVFDNVVTEDVPINERAKLWACARTPYEKTLYVDADTEILSPEIANVFDQLDDNHDMVMGEVREYAHAIVSFPGGTFKYHCGIYLYNNKPTTLNFMEEWWRMWIKQEDHRINHTWDLDDKLFPKNKLAHWDTWGFWRLTELEGWNEKIKIKTFDNIAKWNYHNYRVEELKGEDIVILHHTLRGKIKHNEKNIAKQRGSEKNPI
jgi:hypothetical protein